MLKRLVCGSLAACSLSLVHAQPAHVPIAGYQTAGLAGWDYANAPIGASHNRFDVAVHNTLNYHLQSGTVPGPNGTSEFGLVKKNATTGAVISTLYVDGSVLMGLAANEDVCQAMYFNEATQRAYLVGSYGPAPGKALIICINTATMTLDPTFGGTGGVLLNNQPSRRNRRDPGQTRQPGGPLQRGPSTELM